MRVVVVGAGIMGLAAGWGLARAGHAVAVLEQGPIPNPLAASADHHRLIRTPYGAFAAYAALVAEAHRSWDLLWADLGETLYVETGTLVLAGPGALWPHQSAAALAELGRPVRWLDRATLAARFPLIDPAGVEAGFHLPDGGALLAEPILAALARHLRARGVTLRAHTPVRAIDAERAAVVVEGGERIAADALVVAAGAWVGKLVPQMARRVTPSRQVLIYLEPPAETKALWARAPMIIDLGAASGFYLAPPVAGTPLKVGDHRFSLAGDPDRGRETTAADGAAIHALCRRRIRGCDRFGIVGSRACFYTVAPDERFIVEPLAERSWVVSACSGHGFKFGALIGLRLAAALEDPAAAARLPREAAGRA